MGSPIHVNKVKLVKSVVQVFYLFTDFLPVITVIERDVLKSLTVIVFFLVLSVFV